MYNINEYNDYRYNVDDLTLNSRVRCKVYTCAL